ncbi:hypothetical protein ABRY23_09090 [Melioribacteraceae bacterium 4301-Me]|uniref:hypothetical protein n=1 Tax=Pyranulibacter aquaticus TaxID=3163344 RepID=UPI003594DB5C
MNIVDIFLIILLICAALLCIYLILYLKKIVIKIEEIQKDIHAVVDNTLPVLENLIDSTGRVNKVITEIENYWNELDNSIKTLKNKVADFTSFKKFREDENPAKNIIKNLRAIIKGISAFWREYKS